MSNVQISIIICTYNRADILNYTLGYLSEQTLQVDFIEILLIDNNSTDYTKKVIVNIQKLDSRIKYFLETKQGLSYARNRGAIESSSNWLLYLDDDAKLSRINLDKVIRTMHEYNFSLFTGVWKAWNLTPPPKWLPNSTGNYILKGPNEIREIGNDYVTGLIMIIDKQKLQEIEGFPIHLGMTGKTVAYGEESYVENEFKKRGWKVGINPNIVIDHLVGEYKYKLTWHLEAAYAKGRDNQVIYEGENSISVLILIIKATLLGWIKPLIKLLIQSNYYWQNFVIDYGGAIKYFLGVWLSVRKSG